MYNRGGAFVSKSRLAKSIALSLVLGVSGFVGSQVQAINYTAATDRVNINTEWNSKATATGKQSVAVGGLAKADAGYTIDEEFVVALDNRLYVAMNAPIYIYRGGSSNESKEYSGGTQVKTTGDKDYTISNLRGFAFTDGLQAETVTENGNDIVKVGMTKDYMTKLDDAIKGATDATNAANTAANDAGKAAVKANEAADNANKAAERVNNAIGDMKGSGIEAGDVYGTKDSLAAGKGSDVKADEGTAIGNGAKVTDKATNSVAIGAGSVADRPNTVSVGSEGHERVITNVAPGLIAKDSTDAVNGGQLYAVEQKVDTNTERIGQVAQQVGNNTQAIRDLRKESRKGDAMNAALAALKPVAYNPAEPTQIMAGVGFNHGEQAVAIGAAHYVNGRTMLNAGIAYAGNSDVMANVGVTWRVGQGEVPEDKAVEADKAAAELNSRVQSLEQTVNEQREQIEKLMALLQAK